MITSHKISDGEERASSHDKGSRFDATAETVLWCSNYKVVKKDMVERSDIGLITPPCPSLSLQPLNWCLLFLYGLLSLGVLRSQFLRQWHSLSPFLFAGSAEHLLTAWLEKRQWI